METIVQALEQAGYTVVRNGPALRSEHFNIIVVKDGIHQGFSVSPSISPVGVAEMLSWLEQKHTTLQEQRKP